MPLSTSFSLSCLLVEPIFIKKKKKNKKKQKQKKNKKKKQENNENYIDVQGDRQLWQLINNLKTHTHTHTVLQEWDKPTKFVGPDYEKNISTLSMCG